MARPEIVKSILNDRVCSDHTGTRYGLAAVQRDPGSERRAACRLLVNKRIESCLIEGRHNLLDVYHFHVWLGAQSPTTHEAWLSLTVALLCSANDLCKEAKRSTITSQDVLKALEELEFPTEYLSALTKAISEDG
jgi:hypothetical protein